MAAHNEKITRKAGRIVRMRDNRIHEAIVNRNRACAADLV